jgi:hypothetical protein
MTKNSRRSRVPVWLAGSLFLALALCAGACRSVTAPPGQAADREALARRYQETHDYRSLVALLPLLEIRATRRSEIEKLFGPPAYCPNAFQSYYPTDRAVPVGLQLDGQEGADGRQPMRFQVILVVQYLDAGSDAKPSDMLDAFSLGPVGE